MLHCRESSRLIRASLERKLSLAEKARLYFHLGMCHLCRRYKRQQDFLEETLQRARWLASSRIKLEQPSRERILQRLRS